MQAPASVMTLLLWGPAVVYLCVIGYITAKLVIEKPIKDPGSFAKGSNNYKSMVIFLTVLATFVGPGYSLGYIDRLVSFGAAYIPIYMLATVHLFILGLTLRKNEPLFSRLKNHRSIGDFVAYSYGTSARVLVGLLVFVQTVAFAGILCYTGALVLESIYGVSSEFSTLAIAVVVALYCLTCGLPGVLKTEGVQLGFAALFPVLAVVLILVWYNSGVSRVEDEQFMLFSGRAEPETLVMLLNLGFAFLLGEAFQPYWINRSFVAESAKGAARGYLFAAGVAVVWFAILGILGLTIGNTQAVDPTGSGRIFSAVRVVFPDAGAATIVLGLLGAGFLGIIMSTLDSMLNAGAVSFADDVLGPTIGIDEDQKLPTMRLLVLLCGLGGAFLAVSASDIVDMLLFAYTFWVPLVVPQLALGFFRNAVYERGGAIFWLAAGAGLLGVILAQLSGLDDHVPSLMVGFTLNVLVLVVLLPRSSHVDTEIGDLS